MLAQRLNSTDPANAIRGGRDDGHIGHTHLDERDIVSIIVV